MGFLKIACSFQHSIKTVNTGRKKAVKRVISGHSQGVFQARNGTKKLTNQLINSRLELPIMHSSSSIIEIIEETFSKIVFQIYHKFR